MPILSREDLPDDLRQESAEAERERIRELLRNPLLTQEDRENLRRRLEQAGALKDYSEPPNPDGIDPRGKGVIFR